MTVNNGPILKTAGSYFNPWWPCFVVALCLTTLGVSVRATAQQLAPTYTFNSPALEKSLRFGQDVALDGDYILIGDPWNNTFGYAVGQAHLFDATTGNILRTFNAPNPTPDENFGTAIAIDGNNILISAPRDDTLGDSVGQVYLFSAATGNLLRTFNNPDPTHRDSFGYSIALDGNNVLIGAAWDDTLENYVGQAHQFDATTGNLLWTFNDPTPTTKDNFGKSVAIDGNNILIGARSDDTLGENIGQAHLFDATTGNLLRTFNDPAPTLTDLFGWSVDLDGNNILVGAWGDDTLGTGVGQAHLFDVTTGNLLGTFNDPTPTKDAFGGSVAIDGNNVLIGAAWDDTLGQNRGQVHLFELEGAFEPFAISGGGETYSEDFDSLGTGKLMPIGWSAMVGDETVQVVDSLGLTEGPLDGFESSVEGIVNVGGNPQRFESSDPAIHVPTWQSDLKRSGTFDSDDVIVDAAEDRALGIARVGENDRKRPFPNWGFLAVRGGVYVYA